MGVAHGARIGGIRMLDGDINDRLEGLSLQHALDKYVVCLHTSCFIKGHLFKGQPVRAHGFFSTSWSKGGIFYKGQACVCIWIATAQQFSGTYNVFPPNIKGNTLRQFSGTFNGKYVTSEMYFQNSRLPNQA